MSTFNVMVETGAGTPPVSLEVSKGDHIRFKLRGFAQPFRGEVLDGRLSKEGAASVYVVVTHYDGRSVDGHPKVRWVRQGIVEIIPQAKEGP